MRDADRPSDGRSKGGALMAGPRLRLLLAAGTLLATAAAAWLRRAWRLDRRDPGGGLLRTVQLVAACLP